MQTKKLKLMSCVLALGLVGCGEGEIKEEVKALLIDPSSAEFKNISKFHNGNYCGEVNSKNRMGGYVGFKPFSKIDGEIDLSGIRSLSHQCEIAKDPISDKCQKLEKEIKTLDKELTKEIPFKGVFTSAELKDMKIKKDAEFTMLLCINRIHGVKK